MNELTTVLLVNSLIPKKLQEMIDRALAKREYQFDIKEKHNYEDATWVSKNVWRDKNNVKE